MISTRPSPTSAEAHQPADQRQPDQERRKADDLQHGRLDLVDGIGFLPHELAVWVVVVAVNAGVLPVDVITECVRDGYVWHRGRALPPRETIPREVA